MQCFVFGPARSGKTSLLRALAGPAEAALPPGKRSTPSQQRDQLEEDSVTAVLPMRTEAAQGGERFFPCMRPRVETAGNVTKCSPSAPADLS